MLRRTWLLMLGWRRDSVFRGTCFLMLRWRCGGMFRRTGFLVRGGRRGRVFVRTSHLPARCGCVLWRTAMAACRRSAPVVRMRGFARRV
jgi:hypothetical protein